MFQVAVKISLCIQFHVAVCRFLCSFFLFLNDVNPGVIVNSFFFCCNRVMYDLCVRDFWHVGQCLEEGRAWVYTIGLPYTLIVGTRVLKCRNSTE